MDVAPDNRLVDDDRVRISYLLLADYAEIANGKLSAMGIGWDWIRQDDSPQVPPGSPPIPPPPVRFAIAVGLSVGWHHTNSAIPIEIALEDDKGVALFKLTANFTAGRPPTHPQGAPVRAVQAFPVLMRFPHAGTYRVLATLPQHDQQEVWRFTVIAPQAPPQIIVQQPPADVPPIN